MKRQIAIHVGLNAHLLSRQTGYRRAGIHNYIRQIIRHLPASDEQLQFTVFADHVPEDQVVHPDGLNWQTSRWSTERPWARIVWEQLVQPWALRRARVHLLHGMAFVSPLLTSVPAVITVHDLSFLRFPEQFRPLKRLYLSTMTRHSCQRARRIIAVSQATANEAVRLLGVSEERIDVVPNGVDHAHLHPRPARQVRAFRQAKGLPERFVLFLGTLEPRKNLTTLIQAFAHTQAARQGVKLVIAGGKGWYYQEIFASVEQFGLEDAVLFPGFVPDAELPLWYNTATVFVYPSIYEGFGLPLLEAMACGTPVIGADASCIPEVVGDAGLLVTPHDAAALGDALERLLADADLRADLGQRGRALAAGYTWEAAANATVDSYRRALAD